MNGLDKIIDRIISEAEESAKLIKEQSEAEISVIEEESKHISEKTISSIEERTRKEEAQISARAESSAAMARRNALLDAKSKVLDETYEVALNFFLELPDSDYVSLLVKILAGTLASRIGDLEQMRAYGEEYITDYDNLDFEIVLNSADNKKFGDKILSQFRDEYASSFDKNIISRVKISDTTADIPGGLILCHGDVEANCSIDLLIDYIRPELDAKVYNILFA